MLPPSLRRLRSVFFLTALAFPTAAFAQNESIIVEAESGTLGAQFQVAADGATQYATIVGTVGGFNPTTVDRTIAYSVTFPSAGTYELYARLRVGPQTFSDDSFYYANGFGAKNPASDADWILANGLAAPVGYTLAADKVVGGGSAQSNVWKWVKLSAFDGGEPPVAGFVVPADALVQTFQIAGREDGLFIDKLAFGRQGVFFTVFDLDNGLPGTTVPPPPPYVPPGPPIATGQPKFLGGVSSASQDVNFKAYWNQVTPENGGKWGSVEGTRDVMNWADLDRAAALARANGFPLRLHTLVWGNQQPAWIESLPPAEQLSEIHEWFAALAERYPDAAFIDVVNEPLHDPPAGAGNGNYLDALGGSGATGWDWIVESFRLARQYFPQARLGLNEYSVTNTTADMLRYVGIVNVLKERGLIDTVGVQGHAFSTRVPNAVTSANLDLLAATGLPIYVTELDIDGPTDEVQLADYQRIFPLFWEHPSVRGITLWGYRPGHWRTAQGAYIVYENGAERPAMVWLQGYVRDAVLRPWITASPSSVSATVGDDVSFACAGDGSGPLAYQWRKDGVAMADATTASLLVEDVVTADAGAYDCVVSNAAGSAVSAAATLAVAKASAALAVSDLAQTYDGTPRAVTVTTAPAGLAVVVTYDGASVAPAAPGAYAVVATVQDADYEGATSATLVVSTAIVVRHAPVLNGRVDGSVQVLSPESVTLNGGARVTGDLLVPGTPLVRVNGQPSYGGTVDYAGAAAPSAHTVTLNGGAALRHVARRTDAAPLPVVAPPAAPAGTRDVVLNAPGQSPGDFATVRNLTLNGGAGTVAVPPGAYGAFTVNGSAVLVLGVAGGAEPSVYDLSALTLNGGAALRVAGPVVLTVGSNVTVNGAAGDAADPSRLALRVASGGLTVNGGASVSAGVTASGAVSVNGALRGRVAAERLTVNGGGTLTAP